MKKRWSYSLMALAVLGSANARADSLGEALQSVLQHPGITARQAQSAAAEDDLGAARATYFGSASLAVDDTHYNAAQFMGAFTPAAFANPTFAADQLRYSVNYNLPIDLFGTLSANRARAQTDLDAARLGERQETLLRLHQALSAWVHLQALADKTQALDAERQQITAMVKRVTGEVAAGISATSDLSLAQSEEGRVEAESVRLAGERASVEAMLEDAIGHPVSLPIAAGTVTTIPAWPDVATDQTLPVRIAGAKAASAEQGAHAASRTLLPALSADAGYARYDGAGLAENTWYVGARVSMPIDPSAWHKRDAAAAQAEAARDTTQAVEREANRNMIELKAGYDMAIAAMAAEQREITHRQDVVAVQDELARVGAITTEDALLHQRELVDAKARLADARAEAITAWSTAQVLSGADPQAYIHAISAR